MEQENETEVKESINIFLYNGPVSRLYFIITVFMILLWSFAYMYAFLYLYEEFGTVNHLPLFIGFGIAYLIITIYLSVLNYAKRVYDLIGDKQKAMFYTILWYIANTAAAFIPVVNYIFVGLSALLFIFLVVKRGKLVR